MAVASAATGAAVVDEGGSSDTASLSSLKEALRKVEVGLIPLIDQLVEQASSSSSSKSSSSIKSNSKKGSSSCVGVGIDFLHVKNTLLLSYLIDLVALIRENNVAATTRSSEGMTVDENGKVDDDDGGDHSRENKEMILRRLNEMKVVIDKLRGMDKKLRYQIDKLLTAASTTSSSTAFAVRNTQHDDEKEEDSDDDEQRAPTAVSQQSGMDDPLQYRPADPKSLLDDDEDDDHDDDDDDDEGNEQNSDADSNSNEDGEKEDGTDDDDDDEDDDDLAAARATLNAAAAKKDAKHQSKLKKTKTKNMESDGMMSDENEGDDAEDGHSKSAAGVYRAPRLTSVPYQLDVAEKQRQEEKRQRKRLRNTELAATLKAQYGDAPEAQDIHGGGSAFGKQQAQSRQFAQRMKDKLEYEESAFIRLTTSRQEKKQLKKLQRLESSNLSAIANLGNLVRETQAFGRSVGPGGDGDDDEYEDHVHRQEALRQIMDGSGDSGRGGGGGNREIGGGGRHANGKRRRDDHSSSSKKSPRSFAKNSLQAALYSGRGGGGNLGKKTKKNKK